MEEYLQHWWSGDLNQYYELGKLSMDQLNKIIKLLQYVVGLSALFEIFEFSSVMRNLKVVSHLSIFTLRLPHLLLNLPNLVTRFALGIVAGIGSQMSFGDAVRSVFRNYVLTAADRAAQQASQHRLVLIFQWLERHPLSETWRKIIVFFAFAILSLFGIFTS